MNSRNSGLTTVKTTSAPSFAALSRMGRTASRVRTRVCRRIWVPECGNCNIAARTTFSAVSPVESLRISMRRISTRETQHSAPASRTTGGAALAVRTVGTARTVRSIRSRSGLALTEPWSHLMLGLMLTAGHIESHVARIERDGYSVEDAIEPALLDALRADLERIEAKEKNAPAS